MRTTHFKNLLLVLASAAFLGGVVALPLAAHAQQASGASAKSDKLDVSGLEKKYWASKDTDFSVVQNRTYSKVHRFSLAAEYGSLISDPYSNGSIYVFSGNYYFTERYGVEIQGALADLHNNDAMKNFENLPNGTGVRPNYNRMGNFYGASFNWVPIYAKMSVMNSKIIYFDMAFSPGVGIQQYHQELQSAAASTSTIQNTKSGLAGQFAITQHYFFSNHWSLRVDWTNRWTAEKRATWTVVNGAHSESSILQHDGILSGGLTFFF